MYRPICNYMYLISAQLNVVNLKMWRTNFHVFNRKDAGRLLAVLLQRLDERLHIGARIAEVQILILQIR